MESCTGVTFNIMKAKAENISSCCRKKKNQDWNLVVIEMGEKNKTFLNA